MGKKYDFETFIADLEVFLKANLETYINQVNTEKNDDIDLDIPDANAYYFQTIHNETDVPYSLFVFYGEVNTGTQKAGPDKANTYTVQVAIIKGNSAEAKGVMGKRMLRYREALDRCLSKGWNSINKTVKVETSGISPFPFSLTDNTFSHMGIGINIEVTIA